MKPVVRATLLAALLAASAASAIGATVAPYLLDFEALGTQALGDPTASPPVPAGPVAVGIVAGFQFSGAFAYEYDMLTSADIRPGDNANQGGFIMNRVRPNVSDPSSFLPTVLALTLDSTVYPGQFFTGIQFDVYTNSPNPELTAFSASGSWQVADLTPGNSNKLWTRTANLTIDPLLQVTRLEFSTTQGGGIGLDNLSITLSDASIGGGGGTVPEPASYALVGLALLGMGMSRRRRA